MVPTDAEGMVDLAALETLINPRTALLSVPYVDPRTGVIQPVEALAALCRERQIPLHLEGDQALGQIALSLSDIDVDYFTFSGEPIHAISGCGGLFAKAGRPLLIVPYGISALTLKNAFVAWKDSPEARRAVADAMPLLKLTKNVTVLEATTSKTEEGAQERGMDVARWLEAHNVSAEPVTTRLRAPDADGLRTELVERGCDFLVAGAYGHSRAGEFCFGGVTRDLLLNPEYCVLISH